MNTKPVPLPAPEDLATERLVAVAESAIGGMQERLANFAADGHYPRAPRDIGNHNNNDQPEYNGARI
jgi:hypothetical protein